MPEIRKVLVPPVQDYSSRGNNTGSVTAVTIGFARGDVGTWYTAKLESGGELGVDRDEVDNPNLHLDFDFADAVKSTSGDLARGRFNTLTRINAGVSAVFCASALEPLDDSDRGRVWWALSTGDFAHFTPAEIAESVTGLYYEEPSEFLIRRGIFGLNIGTTREVRIRQVTARLEHYDTDGQEVFTTLATFDLPAGYWTGDELPEPDPTAGLDQVGRVGPLAHDDITQGIEIFEIGRVGPGHALREVGRVCLLYTSPSPRDRQKSRMPSSA